VNFVHEDPEFQELVSIVARNLGRTRGLVEKDYWVTHTLWALHDAGFDVWFKGGTSLSKGFGLITRFSEDLDLKIEPGNVPGIRPVTDWDRKSTTARNARREYFEALASRIIVPGASSALDKDSLGKEARGANIRVQYPCRHATDLQANGMSTSVLLEIGDARVTPSLLRDLSSFVHDQLAQQVRISEYIDNRPQAVRCLHPQVTLLEKLDALTRKFTKPDPAKQVRHFEDCAQIIRRISELPDVEGHPDPSALITLVCGEGQLRASNLAFNPDESEQWRGYHTAYAEIAGMFWGPRIPLDEACAEIRRWLQGHGL
jgi:hypothetical protein